jgi:hypothetical protein
MARARIRLGARLAIPVAAFLVALACTPIAAADTAAPVPATPGGTIAWTPTGRQVLGRPVLYTGSSGNAFVAWMDPQLVRPAVVPGTADPGGPWPWGGQVAPESRPFLVAGFNGGFKWGDADGAILAFGTSYRAPVGGEASLVVYDDGSFTVGQWGRDIDPAKKVVALRQNLGMLVDAGVPTAAASNPGSWGYSVVGIATMRSGVGIDAKGALLWAGGRVSPLDLAHALVASGAVRAMELDINPDWVNFNSYDVGADKVVHGSGLFGATGPDRYLHPNGRDFIVVLVRGTVVTGASKKLGSARLSGEVRLR